MKSLASLVEHRRYQLIFITGPLATLIVNPWSSYDPISLIKMLVVSSFGFGLFFLMCLDFKVIFYKLSKIFWICAALFLCGMLISFIFSGAPWGQQLWGSFGRNTGLLTYFSLLVILLGVALLQNNEYYEKIAKSLIFTAVPMTLYCFLQIANKDPIGWSEFAVFGTLGNVNFLSAFFGMTSVACFVLLILGDLNWTKRLFLLFLCTTDLGIAYNTGSIQGVAIFSAGLSIFVLFWILKQTNFVRIYLATYILSFGTLLYCVIQALNNKGFLASVLYQPSVTFRGDYIHAGWKMTLSKPFFGVGLDSYGDWYREMRGEISTLRTGPDRISNTAHNIFLDISSTGGIVPGFAYLAMIGIAAFGIWKIVRKIRITKELDSTHTIIACVWFAYQIQALVSINQIGVGIWGWVFTGALIGISSMEIDTNQVSISHTTKSRFRGKLLPPQYSLMTFLGFVLGFIVAYIPFSADVQFRAANQSGDITRISNAVDAFGSTQFHRELALDFALRNNLNDQVGILATQLVEKYPRSYFGWRVLSVWSLGTSQTRGDAYLRARQLDPFNPELR